MKKRRENPPVTSSAKRALNQEINKHVRHDLRCSNTLDIERAIELNRGSKVFVQSLGRSHLTKLTTTSGEVISSVPAVLSEVENFYGRLYASHASRPEMRMIPEMRILELLGELQKLFNAVLFERRTPEAWSRSVVVLFFKKGDKTLLKNYRLISLLSHVYKLFSRVIMNRLARILDEFQPPAQARFRSGYGTIYHIHTVRQIIQKTGRV
ncbi:hypothetical protein B5X24_HaOG208332 [Helicoverpa armigera]|nr:hypothetical protein B5X24_HaOG208332 [Helicoverpa armigera]